MKSNLTSPRLPFSSTRILRCNTDSKMGLQSHLNDVSSDSIALFLVAFIAKFLDHLRSLLFSLFHSLGLSRFGPSPHAVGDDGLVGSMGSGLSGLIVLAEQLNINRVFSYRYCCRGSDDLDSTNKGGSDCVVCLCTLKHGDQVRKLDCRHIFHKECFDGWLDHLNFNCPLCRSPLVSEERVDFTRRRVGEDLMDWFSMR